MKPYVKIYFEHFGYCGDEFIPCEICGMKAVDIHHIDCRGMGGSENKDRIENLMAVCRKCHMWYGDKKEHMDFLLDIHNQKLQK